MQALPVSKQEALPFTTLDIAALEINNVAGTNSSNRVSQTFYVPVLFPNCKEP